MNNISAGSGAGEVAGLVACDASCVLITTKYYVYSINNGLEILRRKQKRSPSPQISEKPCDSRAQALESDGPSNVSSCSCDLSKLLNLSEPPSSYLSRSGCRRLCLS